MSQYKPPLADMQFVIAEVAGLDGVAALPGFEDATSDTVDAILEEAGKFATGVLDPLNGVGDREGARWRTTARGHAARLQGRVSAVLRAGWNGLAKDPEFGGQGMPQLVAAAVDEMWNAANMAFSLCPMLTAGAIEAIERNGSDALKRTYLPKMVSGEWTGTMNLTEPQAGSDLAAVRTKAVPQGDGTLPDLRQQDLHHLRRARLGGQHHPPRARAHARRAAGREGHLAVRRAQVPRERGRQPRRAQRRALRVARAQARHPRESDCGAGVRRPRRRDRLPRRRGESRPRVHVRDDERGALRRRHAGRRDRRARLPARAGLRARARAGARRRRAEGRRGRRASSAIPTCGAC